MKIKLVGRYQLGFRNIAVFADLETANGSVNLVPSDHVTVTEVYVGIDCSYRESIGVLLHELYEGCFIDLSTRYKTHPGFSNESSDYVFFMTHNQLGEAHERVGCTLTDILPNFSKVYRKFSPYKG